jgi:tetratricopeptide (TPR) repeat protein
MVDNIGFLEIFGNVLFVLSLFIFLLASFLKMLQFLAKINKLTSIFQRERHRVNSFTQYANQLFLLAISLLLSYLIILAAQKWMLAPNAEDLQSSVLSDENLPTLVQEKINSLNQDLLYFRENGDRKGEADSLNNLGLAYHTSGEFEKAISFHNQALTIFRELGDQQGEAAQYGNLARIAYSRGDVEQAREYFESALLIYREIEDRYGEGNVVGALGAIYHALGQTDQALKYYHQALILQRNVTIMKKAYGTF